MSLKFLTAEDVAELFGMHINWVRANAHELGGVKYGKSYRFLEEDVLAAHRARQARQTRQAA